MKTIREYIDLIQENQSDITLTAQEARELIGFIEEWSYQTSYNNEEDEVGVHSCCQELSYRPHATDCPAMQAMTLLKSKLHTPKSPYLNRSR